MKTKALVIEIALLIGLFMIWFIAYCLLSTLPFFKPFSDINLHDTYFNFDWRVIIIAPYLMIVTLSYLLRERFYGYKRKLQNMIMIGSNFIFVLLLPTLFSIIQLLVREANGWMTRHWTLYPPLSALSKIDPHAVTENQFIQYATMIDSISNIKVIFTTLFMLILVITSFLAGKNWNSKHEPKS